jgi:hypothetical protein
VAVCTPGCALRARSIAEEQDEQCIPLTEICMHAAKVRLCLNLPEQNLGQALLPCTVAGLRNKSKDSICNHTRDFVAVSGA